MKRILTALLASSLLLCACSDGDGRDENGSSSGGGSSTSSGDDYVQYWGGYTSTSQSTLFVNGHACKDNSECLSNNCYKNTVCRVPGWDDSKAQGAEDGGACQTNKGCQSGICVNSVCVSSTSVDINISNASVTNTSASASTAGDKATGEACTAHTECESGQCTDGKCSDQCAYSGCSQPYHVCRHNKCIPTETIGNECTKRSECSIGQNCCNGFCVFGSCEVGISCYDTGCDSIRTDSGRKNCRETGGLKGNAYQTSSSSCMYNCAIGTDWGNLCTCDNNEECGDGYYCDRSGEVSPQLCIEKKALNQKCRLHSECKSGFCSPNDICDNKW